MTTIITMLGFVITMVAWGIRLEGKVNDLAGDIESKELLYGKLNDQKQVAIDRRLDSMQQEIFIIRNRLRDGHADHDGHKNQEY
ncbi:hypothetical protein NX722_05645 [Endozoicomonas gorgoniicola]|uniref:Phage shock protein B n=1 Tax=Endozoicomonas gorgoniicola TaxID=1234144 RepID=A0ABT3MRZ0_9GAMM|nr:hypothetical protein [Endozoicomonas gorgoniicola]MCW7552136.1 hypothetical protein [Endozoicomonas gorgoniicola]